MPPALQNLLGGENPDHNSALADAITQIGHQRLNEFLDGVRSYRASLFRRDLREPDIVFREGTTKVRLYAARARPLAPALLVIPSLVNRYYVMDLAEDISFLRYCAAAGFTTYVVDWDAPGEDEQNFGFDDYVLRLDRILDFLKKKKHPISVLGYCMGGLFALAVAARNQQGIKALACLATPYDFNTSPIFSQRIKTLGAFVTQFVEHWGHLPVDFLQFCFASIDPIGLLNKFRAFGRVAPDSPQARRFVLLEDWLNDGIPLTAKIANTCFAEWYGNNCFMAEGWCIAGKKVDLTRFTLPSYFAIPASDRIVPPESAMALAKQLPHAHLHQPPAGHIGMMVGSKAQQFLWQPLTAWLDRYQ